MRGWCAAVMGTIIRFSVPISRPIIMRGMGLKRTVTDGVRSIAPPSVFNYARRVYHWLGDMTVRPHVETHVYGGVPLSVHIENRGARAGIPVTGRSYARYSFCRKGGCAPAQQCSILVRTTRSWL